MIAVDQIYTHSPLRNFTYLLYDPKSTRAIVIDPFDGDQIAARLKERGLQLSAIINTHEHHDHTCGNQALLDQYRVPVWAHPGASRQVPGFSEALSDGQQMRLGDDTIEGLHTPGHTFAHLSLLLKTNGQDRAIFSGDTFFNAGVGNCYNGGDAAVLYETICERYQVLADHVRVYPGHDYLLNNLRFTLEYEPQNQDARLLLAEQEQIAQREQGDLLITDMAMEKKINTFLRLNQTGLQNALMDKVQLPQSALQSEKEVFLGLRALRDRW